MSSAGAPEMELTVTRHPSQFQGMGDVPHTPTEIAQSTTSSGDDITGATTTSGSGAHAVVGKVSKRVQFSYGAPGFATTSLSFLISVYANDFYVAVGASLSFLSFFTALARSFDVITDPVMGWFSDRFKHPMGRRRPFILLGAPFYGLLFFLLFSPTLLMNRHTTTDATDFPVVNPTNVTSLESQWRQARGVQHIVDGEGCDTGSTGIAYWFGTFYTVFYLFDTLSNVPYESLGPELSDSYDERSRIFFIAKVFNFLGMMFAAGAPATGQAFYRNRHKSMESMPCDYFYNPYADTNGHASSALYRYEPFAHTLSRPPPQHTRLASSRRDCDDGHSRARDGSERLTHARSRSLGWSQSRHGNWHPYQLVYEDTFSNVHRLAEHCNNGKGDFCFVMRLHSLDGKTHDYFFEQDPVTIENTCGNYWCSFLSPSSPAHAFFGNITASSSSSNAGMNGLSAAAGVSALPPTSMQPMTTIATTGGGMHNSAALTTYAASHCKPGIDYSAYANSRVTFRRYSIASVDAKIVSYQAVSAIFAIYYVMTMINLVWTVKERKRDFDQTNVPLVPSILRTFSNRAFGPLLAAWALDGLALSALVSMFPFYIRYVIKPSSVEANPVPAWMKLFINTTKMPSEWCMGLSVAALLLVAICSAPFWLWLSLKKGKFQAWLWYNAANAFSNILFLVPGAGDWELAISIMAINGFPVGGQFLINSILSDVIDYDEFLNGSRSEGSFSVFATLIPKFVSIPAGALPLAIIYILGFRAPIDGVDQHQTQTVISFIRFCFILLPFVCVCLAFAIKTTFPIKTKETAETISEGIQLHAQGLEALDPLTGEMTKLLSYSEEESEVVWNLESFTHKMLLGLLENRDHRPIVRTIQRNIGFAVFLEVAFLTLVIVFFKDLCDPAMAIIPILAIIFFGIMLCYLLVNISRYIDAKKLVIFEHNEKSRELLARVIQVRREPLERSHGSPYACLRIAQRAHATVTAIAIVDHHPDNGELMRASSLLMMMYRSIDLQVKKKGQRAGLYEPLVRQFSMSLRKISNRLGSFNGKNRPPKSVLGLSENNSQMATVTNASFEEQHSDVFKSNGNNAVIATVAPTADQLRSAQVNGDVNGKTSDTTKDGGGMRTPPVPTQRTADGNGAPQQPMPPGHVDQR